MSAVTVNDSDGNSTKATAAPPAKKGKGEAKAKAAKVEKVTIIPSEDLELVDLARKNNPYEVFIIPSMKNGHLYKNQPLIAGYLGLNDTDALTSLTNRPNIVPLLDAHFREKANKFGAAQTVTIGLQGKQVTPSKAKDDIGTSIQVKALYTSLEAGDVITKAEIAACPHLPLPTDHVKYGTGSTKMAGVRKIASCIYTLARLTVQLEFLREEETSERVFLLETASGEDFWRAYQFLQFYEQYKHRRLDTSINVSAKEPMQV